MRLNIKQQGRQARVPRHWSQKVESRRERDYAAGKAANHLGPAVFRYAERLRVLAEGLGS